MSAYPEIWQKNQATLLHSRSYARHMTFPPLRPRRQEAVMPSILASIASV